MQEAVGRPQPTCNLEGEDGGLHLVIHNTINDERFKIALEWGCTLGNAAIALWGGLAEFRSTDTFGVRSKGVQIDVAAKVDDLYKAGLEHGHVVELYNEELRSRLLSDLRVES
ncbi:hypothetical protein LTR09_000003 [Extremus antarcticus]|uniref:Uncharacterized protein n=1 Tax=Extremus antarcticus TaxID=702011 RepID=A0AAJ0LX50_9PEZI|nr:hypothetical protein LTR09_000003 [Extremus antarcticus]